MNNGRRVTMRLVAKRQGLMLSLGGAAAVRVFLLEALRIGAG